MNLANVEVEFDMFAALKSLRLLGERVEVSVRTVENDAIIIVLTVNEQRVSRRLNLWELEDEMVNTVNRWYTDMLEELKDAIHSTS
tara:strand:- start:3876 stop:4133 length:258 start_codon:yes stop_codon:yes gene_type:complete